MHFAGYLILTFAKILSLILEIYTFIIAAAVIISWVKPDPYNPIVRFLYSATAPLFGWVRRFLPTALFRTGIDFTPMIVIFILIFIQTTVVGLLFEAGTRFLGK
ncbi:MAG: YggT family protein [Deltaproteobacteria bacterium]|nr:YggT family protein [Deltaproteobacteria bacterium]